MNVFENIRRNQILSLVFIGVCLYVGVTAIIGSSYLGLQGNHVWRQAEVLAHTFGFMHMAEFLPFDRFIIGSNEIYDIPLYQFVIAKLSLLFNIDPLIVTRHINFFTALLAAYFGVRFCRIYQEKAAPFAFLFLFATSPLYLHYFSVPLPDNLALCLSVWGLVILLEAEQKRGVFFALLPLIPATLIKSPIPFSFIVFFIMIVAIGRKQEISKKVKQYRLQYAIVLLLLLIMAFATELIRKKIFGTDRSDIFAQDPSWYFGSMELRASSKYWELFWSRIQSCFGFYFAPLYVLILLLHLHHRKGKKSLICMASGFVAYAVSWLVFANVFYQHDYYQIAVMFILMLSFSVAISELLSMGFQSISEAKMQKRIAMSICILISFTLLKPMFQDHLGHKQRVSVFTSMEQILRQEASFLYVGNRLPGPIIGGLVQKKFSSVSIKEFEENCSDYLQKNKAIITSDYVSPCLYANYDTAKTFLQEGIYTLYIQHPFLRHNMFVTSSLEDWTKSFELNVFQSHIELSKPHCVYRDTIIPYRVKLYQSQSSSQKKLVQDYVTSFLEQGVLRKKSCRILLPIPQDQSSLADSAELGQMNADGSFAWKMDVRL
ncbi:MAG: hypothetical protein R3A45_11300 [Bdellovibrionota bacterium]